MNTQSKQDNWTKSKKYSGIVSKSEDVAKPDNHKCLVCSEILVSRKKAVDHILKDHKLSINQGDSISNYIELYLYQIR